MRSKKIAFLYEVFQFKKLLKQIHSNVEQADIIFFFPAYHLGGAERVHADILETFSQYKTCCFITEKSKNDFLKETFYQYTDIIELGAFRSLVYKWYAKKVAGLINRKKKAIIFGCNSSFFYRVLPHVQNHIKVVDLVHAFSFEYPWAAEKLSLPVLEKIDTRIVLGKKTFDDFKQQYHEEGKDENLLSRIMIIPNKVDTPDTFPQKPDNPNLKVLFVGRNSSEKRPEIFLEIVKKSYSLQLPVEFTLIGDFDEFHVSYPNLHIAGSIKEKEKLNQYYLESDLLLITSWREGFPMVILEGMAYGVVPVSTNVGEVPEFINDKNQNGWIIQDDSIPLYLNKKTVSLNDFMPCVDKFIECIAQSAKNRTQLKIFQMNAYQSVKRDFSAAANRKAYLDMMAINGLDKKYEA